MGQDYVVSQQPEYDQYEDYKKSAENNNQFNDGKVKSTNGYKPIKKVNDSPPMIKEHDPNEESAKVRAKKRAEAIKMKEDKFEIDLSLYPDHPAPWKGR